MKTYRVNENQRLNLLDADTDGARSLDKEQTKAETAELLEKLRKLQRRLYAEGKQSLLVVLQAMDTGGKDGTIKSVFSGVNPQGCRVSCFKAPTAEELSHDFLWRIHKETPAKGMIGIFNRSHYEDVLVTRVHGWVDNNLARERFKQIRHFERLLAASGTRMLKFFLHISKEEQKERLQARLDDPERRWKFNAKDLDERKLWKKYMRVYGEALSATSTDEAPWYVIPADRKWFRDWTIANIIVHTLQDMDPRFPKPAKGFDPQSVRIE